MSSNDTELPAFLVKHLDDVATNQGLVDYKIFTESGSNVGDGFMGEVIAVTLDGNQVAANGDKEPHQLRLICKRQPSDALRREKFLSAIVFEREVHMYNEILPFLNRYQREHKLDETNGFFAYPKVFFAFFEPGNDTESIIIMEDLRASGHSACDRFKMPSYEMCKLVLEQIGRLHAVSFVLRDRNPGVLDEFNHQLPEVFDKFIRESEFGPVFHSGYARAVELLKEEPHAEMMKRIQERWIESYRKAFDIKLYERFAVLGHGDCWINNMMFVINNGVADKVTMIDWQTSHMLSPAADITHFLFTATDSEFRSTHLPELLDVYYAKLSETVCAFGCDPAKLFSRADFDQQMRENAFAGVLISLIDLPALICAPEELVGMSEIAKNAHDEDAHETHMAVLNRQTEDICRRRFEEILSDCEKYGWLDMFKS